MENLNLIDYLFYIKRYIRHLYPKTEDMDLILLKNIRPIFFTLSKVNPSQGTIYTHKHLDVDALACSLLREDVKLISIKSRITPTGNDLILDHPSNKNKKGSDYFKYITENRTNFSVKFANAVQECDLGYTNIVYTVEELVQDNDFLRKALEYGIKKDSENVASFKQKLLNCKFFRIGNSMFLAKSMDESHYSSSLKSNFMKYVKTVFPNLEGVIYENKNNLGVLVYPYSNFKLKKFKPHLSEGWYLDVRHGGWLLTWGSKKDRKRTMPPSSDPQNIEELHEFLKGNYVKN